MVNDGLEKDIRFEGAYEESEFPPVLLDRIKDLQMEILNTVERFLRNEPERINPLVIMHNVNNMTMQICSNIMMSTIDSQASLYKRWGTKRENK